MTTIGHLSCVYMGDGVHEVCGCLGIGEGVCGHNPGGTSKLPGI